MELIIFSAIEGLQSEVEQLRDVAVLAPSRIDQVQRLLTGSRPPDAIYLDDSRGTPLADLWDLTARAQQVGAKVLLGLAGPARSALPDALAAGLAATSERNPVALADWIGGQLGRRRGSSVQRLPVIAIGAAKGGIGKTFATCVLAEGLRRRGLDVLVWDSDISNPGLVPAFRVPASAPSYLHLVQRGPAHWYPSGIQPFIFQPEHTRATNQGWGRIDLLIGSHAVARAENDLRLPDWQGLYQGIIALEGYDVVLIDTPPDYLRRPYATHVLQAGGNVVLPTPPGARERMGVGHMLDHFTELAPDRLERCALLFMEPERGVTVTVSMVADLFARRYPRLSNLGVLPREPRLASLADEHDRYVSMLDLGPYSRFTQAIHRVVEVLCAHAGLQPRLPMPKTGWWGRLSEQMFGQRIPAPAVS
ncbi:MAG: chromosome partitioning protein [Chloroflexus aggregans]|uniref:Chromosome partitioning protein n=1 Tax=Chloroflexus aggregans TaxID=152260 RepID=A0A2J6XDZ4_9CHLR|nr:MAG: chromosome partitioning protein [Chloroflexus aggregans]